MIKIFLLAAIYLSSTTHIYSQEKNNKDEFSYNKKTKSIIPNYMGKVILVRGNAQAISIEGSSRSLKKGDKIYKKESIQTKKLSLIRIEMVDTTSVTIGANSLVEFEKFKYRTRKDRDSVIKLVRGKVRAHFQIKSTKKEQLKVRVGSVSMGVRGTKILANSLKLKGNNKVYQIVLLSGAGRIFDSSNNTEKMLDHGEHYISIINRDGNNKNSEFQKLSKDEMKHLTAVDINLANNFRPLLKNYPLAYLTEMHNSQTSSPQLENNHKEYRRKEKKKKSWKLKLNELNKRLQQNNKAQD